METVDFTAGYDVSAYPLRPHTSAYVLPCIIPPLICWSGSLETSSLILLIFTSQATSATEQSVSQFIKPRCVCLPAPVSVSNSLKDEPRPPHNYKHHTLPDLLFGSHLNQLHPPDCLPAELPAGV